MEILNEKQLEKVCGGALLGISSPFISQVAGSSAVAAGGPSNTLLGFGTGNATAVSTATNAATLTSVLVSLF